MRLFLILAALSGAVMAVAQGPDASFSVIRITNRYGETFSLHDATVSYNLLTPRYMEPGVVVERAGGEETVPLDDVLVMTVAATDDGDVQWFVVLTSGEILPGPPAELSFSGTVGSDTHTYTGYLSGSIMPTRGGSNDYVSVLFPENFR